MEFEEKERERDGESLENVGLSLLFHREQLSVNVDRSLVASNLFIKSFV
jgi:hypothetical protein